jgi:hypothetical protein
MMVAVSSSKTSVNFYQTTRLKIPEDSHLRNLFCHVEIRGLCGPPTLAVLERHCFSVYLTNCSHPKNSRSGELQDDCLLFLAFLVYLTTSRVLAARGNSTNSYISYQKLFPESLS